MINGNGITIAGACRNALGIFDDYCAGLRDEADVESAIKEIGWQWLKAVMIENGFIEAYKQATGYKDTDFMKYFPIFEKAEAQAYEKWIEEFGEDNV